MDTILVDIDGTIANCEHRLHHIREKPKNFKKFMEACPQDTPIEPTISIVRMLAQDTDMRVVFCTGRPDRYRVETVDWLSKQGFYGLHNTLYMREQGDYRKDDIVKSELVDQIIADGHNPTMAFEDRQRVVDMLRARGIIVAQVAPGDF